MKIAGKTAVEAIADYLRCLWDHTIESIDRSIGVNTRKNSKFQIVVTVPAIWPHYAQLRMGEAIENAGIMKPGPGGSPSLTFISEPEAAALASMQDLAGRVQFKVSSPQVLIECIVFYFGRKGIILSSVTQGEVLW